MAVMTQTTVSIRIVMMISCLILTVYLGEGFYIHIKKILKFYMVYMIIGFTKRFIFN